MMEVREEIRTGSKDVRLYGQTNNIRKFLRSDERPISSSRDGTRRSEVQSGDGGWRKKRK